MRAVVRLLLAGLLALPPGAWAQSSNILIQVLPGSVYRVWYAEGPSELAEDEIMQLDAAADRAGSAPIETSLGPAQVRQTTHGAIIELLAAPRDKRLLIDRDACGHLKTWHAEGGIELSEEQTTDLVLAALPGGGPRVELGPARYAKSFLTELGVMVAIWKPRTAGGK